ncbi:unnamed protein product [Penicillium salamii]|uniref:Uncharacterized protein n=1 Tax=Penicillium salamii TaxID=1612424 RepID=A0A9W4IYV0_9EURO|nr:unnamed protein product [Penicillium salamii]
MEVADSGNEVVDGGWDWGWGWGVGFDGAAPGCAWFCVGFGVSVAVAAALAGSEDDSIAVVGSGDGDVPSSDGGAFALTGAEV